MIFDGEEMAENKINITGEKNINNNANSQSSQNYPYSGGMGTTYTSFDQQIKTALVGSASALQKWKINEYPLIENYQQNVALFFSVPYLYSGIMVRAHYSLGQPFDFVDMNNFESSEERYIKNFARRTDFKNKLFKTSVHLDVYGNCYWFKERNNAKQVVDIKIIQPERVRIGLDKYGDVEHYRAVFPDFEKQGWSATSYEIPPEDMIHFKVNNFTESPYGTSLLQSIIPLLKERLDLNKITAVIYKAYGKPYRHFKYTPAVDEKPDSIKATIDGMVNTLETSEPDSDLVTTNAWMADAVNVGATKEPIQLLEDVDKQIFAAMGIPKFFFNSEGSTTTNIWKSDMWFRKLMKTRQEYFAETLYDQYIIDELDTVFPKTTNIPILKFEEDFEIRDITEETQSLYNSQLITLEEARKRLGLKNDMEGEVSDKKGNVSFESKKPETKPETETAPKGEQSTLNLRDIKIAMKSIPLFYEKWQDGDLDDKDLIEELVKWKKIQNVK